MTTSISKISALFGEAPHSARLNSFLKEVISSAGLESLEAEVKTYPDAVYFNYYLLGLSLLFIPTGTYQPSTNAPLDHSRLVFDSVDVFNTIKNAASSKGKTYSRFPLLPLAASICLTESESMSTFELKPDTTGKDLVRAFGEPTRKGGGTGPSSGSIGIWCEWTKLGMMIEFGGNDARGPQAWERGKDAVWKVITLFKPKDA